jgi:putative membrane protein insertion efficiency factor
MALPLAAQVAGAAMRPSRAPRAARSVVQPLPSAYGSTSSASRAAGGSTRLSTGLPFRAGTAGPPAVIHNLQSLWITATSAPSASTTEPQGSGAATLESPDVAASEPPATGSQAPGLPSAMAAGTSGSATPAFGSATAGSTGGPGASTASGRAASGADRSAAATGAGGSASPGSPSAPSAPAPAAREAVPVHQGAIADPSAAAEAQPGADADPQGDDMPPAGASATPSPDLTDADSLRDRTATAVRRAVRFVVRAPRYVPVVLLRGYRLLISPLYGPTCRFYPSCSAYALEAFEVHGVFRGGYLTVRRLLRCHPWNPGGVDPVPTSGRRTRKDQAGPSADTHDAPSTRRAA